MKLFKSAVIAVLVLFGLSMTIDADAQTNWKERTEAVETVMLEFQTLGQNPNGYTDGELAVLHKAYQTVAAKMDELEDTEQGYLAWAAEVDQLETDIEITLGNDYDAERDELKRHIRSLVTE